MTDKLHRYIACQVEADFKVGDLVKVTSKCTPNQFGWENTWTDEMDFFLDKIRTIKDITKYGIELLVDDNHNESFCFPFFVLEQVESLPTLKQGVYKRKIFMEGIDVAFMQKITKVSDDVKNQETKSNNISIEEANELDIPRI